MQPPRITIDKYAIRFDYETGSTNIFFSDLFQNCSNRDWHGELMKVIQHCYEECVRYDIKPPKEED